MTTGGLQSKYAGTTALAVLLPQLFSLLRTENIWCQDCNPRSRVRLYGPHRRISTLSNFVNSLATCVVRQRCLSLLHANVYM